MAASLHRHNWLNHWPLVTNSNSSPSPLLGGQRGGTESSNFLTRTLVTSPHPPVGLESHLINVTKECLALSWLKKFRVLGKGWTMYILLIRNHSIVYSCIPRVANWQTPVEWERIIFVLIKHCKKDEETGPQWSKTLITKKHLSTRQTCHRAMSIPPAPKPGGHLSLLHFSHGTTRDFRTGNMVPWRALTSAQARCHYY